jgi:hypothetical protein
MGKTATILAMAQLKLRFLTALTTTEFPSYSMGRLPCDALAGLSPSSTCDGKIETEAARRVMAAGMEQVDDNLFVLDVGVVERPTEVASPVAAQAATPAQAMKLCRRMLDLVASDECPSFEAARRKVGLGKGVASKYRGLQKLGEDIQRDVIAGLTEECSLDSLLKLARLPRDEQRQCFDTLVAAERGKRIARIDETRVVTGGPTVKLHVVGYFNQERFVDQRYRASEELREMRAFVEDLNSRLARARSRRTRASIEAEVDRKLRAHDLLEAFALTLDEKEVAGTTRYHAELKLDEAEWARRRRFDGFALLVASADLPHTAAQLCRLYRAKDVVEKDFHIIKSVVEVRPVRHYTDAKVRAHVTLCMLALLLERTLQHRLRGKCSSEVALEKLEPCRLNQFESTTQAYALTRPTAEQKDLLRHLNLLKLVDDEALAERLRPRT